MTRLAFLAVVVFAAAYTATAQPATAEAAPETHPGAGVTVSFRPSVAIVVGIFTMMFSLTFLLLMYAKFCHPSASDLFTSPDHHLPGDATGGAGGGDNDGDRLSGVDKTVVESLPFFRFAALRGARGGLECAVCLARFDDADLLRLLPRCRHAFHLDCIDRWLEGHASCPLCRTRVAAADAALGLKYSASARFLCGGSDRFDESGRSTTGRDLLEIFVEREPDASASGSLRALSSRFSVSGSFRTTETAAAAADSATREANDGIETFSVKEEEQPPVLDRFKHRIIVSDVVLKSRWSDVNSTDLIALDTEMLGTMSSRRFASLDATAALEQAPSNAASFTGEDKVIMTIKEEMEKKRLLESKASIISRGSSSAAPSTGGGPAARISAGTRSMSEIVNLPRLRAVRDLTGAAEEKAWRLWLPIARRTVRWFAGRERRSVAAARPPGYIKGEVITSAHSKEEIDLATHV